MIEVIKQMVEALEWSHGGEPVGTAEAIKAGKKLIAELESQEPVAWELGVVNGVVTRRPVARPQRTEQKTSADDFFKMIADRNPKPFPPTQRTWIGLTDEETERLIHNFGGDPHTLLDEVDARLKTRNT
jgi:hypothetical protein